MDVVSETSEFKLVDVKTGFGQKYTYINRFGVKDRQNCENMQEVRNYTDMVDVSWYMPLLFQQKTEGWNWISEAMNAGVEGPIF